VSASPKEIASPTRDITGLPDRTVAPNANPPPRNDECVTATTLNSFSNTIAGSTSSATFADSDGLTTCEVAYEDGPGVWYRISNPQATFLTATTCGKNTQLDTKIAVYRGPCSGLTCVAQNDDTAEGESCSTSIWWAEGGTDYYLYIRGFDGSAGDFDLTVRADAPVSNDQCSGAITIKPDGGFTAGSTVLATVDFVGICDSLETTSPGVWYKLVGTGDPVILSTCHATKWDTKISIFRGSCGRLVCHTADDDGCVRGRQSRVDMDTELGQTYFILVHGYQDNTGEFQLHAATKDTVYNDFCEDATALTIGSNVGGNNLLAKFDLETITACDSTVVISGPTVWYEVVGTGGTLVISVCDSRTNFDTQISVFRGGCQEQLVCVGGNDDGSSQNCGDASEFTWKSNLFEFYYIAVSDVLLSQWAHCETLLIFLFLTFRCMATTTQLGLLDCR